MLKVGVQSAGWYNSKDPLGSFERIKACGFNAVDYNIDGYLNGWGMAQSGVVPTIFDKSVEELLEFFTPLKEASEKTGVTIGQMHAPFAVWFKDKDECFKQAISMTCDRIMRCEHIVSVVPYKVKAEAIYNTLMNDVTNEIPATLLKKHADCVIYCDADSAALLDKETIEKYR